MSDMSQQAELVLKLTVQEAETFARSVDKANNETGQLDKNLDKLSSKLYKAGDDFKKAGQDSRAAGSAMEKAGKSGYDEWDQLVQRIKNASLAYREFKKDVALGNATDASASEFMRTKGGLAGGDINRYKAGTAAGLPGADFGASAKGTKDATGAMKANSAATKAAEGSLRSLLGAESEQLNTLPRMRYALYDVATTYGVIATAMLGTGGVAIKTAADFETAFAQVERTGTLAGEELESLRGALVDLSTQNPASFEDVAGIATLANQLGVAEDKVADFSETVIQFSTVSGMSADASAQAFGRLSNLLNIPVEDAQSLGSAIELVGVNSASTDEEIVGLAQRLAATATRAGFTTDQVVGLSGALGSLGVAPERAQGVFERYFNSLNEAVSEGGEKLENFGRITDLSTESLTALVSNGHGFEVFQNFIDGLNATEDVKITGALKDLGLEGLRVSEVIPRLTSRMDILHQAFNDASQGYAEGTELSRQYEIISSTLNSQLERLGNAIAAFAASSASGFIPAMTGAVSALADLINGVREFIDTPIGGFLARSALAIGLVAGGFFAYRAATALATASTYALITAQAGLSASGARAGVSGLVGALRTLRSEQALARGSSVATSATIASTGPAATTAASGVRILRGALVALGRATIIIGAIQLLIELMFNFAGSLKAVADFGYPVIDFLLAAGRSVSDLLSIMTQGIPIVSNFFGMLSDVGGKLEGVAARGKKAAYTYFGKAMAKDADNTSKSVEGLTNWMDELGASAYQGAAASDELSDSLGGGGSGGGGGGGVSNSAAAAAEEVRTLVDYANDLQSVFSRAFDLRFGNDQASDKVASGWQSIKKGIDETNQKIKEYRDTMRSLTADKRVQEYWLSVAENYGDTLRAGQLRASIGKVDSDLKKTSGELTAAQQANSMTLVGNSEAAIANRSNILGLVSAYQEQITALASSGLSSDELARKTEELKQKFIKQATQLGYNRAEVMKYAKSFDDLTTIIKNVPRNVTITANANPALQALSEFKSKFNKDMASMRGDANRGIALGKISNPTNALEVRRGALEAAVAARAAWVKELIRQGNYSGADSASSSLEAMRKKLRYGDYWTGGYVGDGGKYEPKGNVHGGEFVFSKAATKAIGVRNLNYAHQMAKSGGSPMSGGGGGGGASFDPSTLAPIYDMLGQIRDRVGLTIAGPTLASVNGAMNVNSNNRGAA